MLRDSHKTMPYTTTQNGGLATAVDCHKQVRSWRFLRTVAELLLPTCNCANFNIEPQEHSKSTTTNNNNSSKLFTGTIYGFRRRARFSFCIQSHSSKNLNPNLLFLELILPTSVLAREMKNGVLRIALKSNDNFTDLKSSSSLFSIPLWDLYCNGRKVGYAVRKEPSKTDFEALKALKEITVGAGVVKCDDEIRNLKNRDDLMYLRANFRRVFGSSDSESFHLIDPDGIIGQELSVFFFRSR